MEKNNFITVPEAATLLKITAPSVRSLIRDGLLSAQRVGKQWVIAHDDLDSYITKNHVVIKPDDHPRNSDGIPHIVALSFFSGAMGLDIGMRNGGIETLLACENDDYCRMTINENNPSIGLIGDITKYDAKDIRKMAVLPADARIDIIYGGPPCQAFSTAGHRKAFEDSRGNVFLRYLDIVGDIKPTYIVIENVRGLLSAEYPYKAIANPIKGGAMLVIIDRLQELGYTLSFELYNAANFGAPQIRERVVMIGKLNGDKVPYLSPTNSDEEKYGLPAWNTLADALKCLPTDTEHHYIPFPEKRLKYYRMLTEGQYWKHLPPDIQIEAMGDKLQLGGGKTGFYRRLSFQKPSPTLVTNPTMPATDLCHPTEDRPLSIEEYGCIQGFPPSWKICGPILEQYRQIGNAVPIKLGEAIARTLLADMEGKPLPQVPGFRYSRYKNTSDASWRKQMDGRLSKLCNENQQLCFSDLI